MVPQSLHPNLMTLTHATEKVYVKKYETPHMRSIPHTKTGFEKI